MNTLTELAKEPNKLLSDEDLTDEKLREASEGLLPNISDYLNNKIRNIWESGKEWDNKKHALSDVKMAIEGGALVIMEERYDQIYKHGWDLNNDKYYANEELLQAAMFCLQPLLFGWPEKWDQTFKCKVDSKPRIERLTVAGALIAAEIDRLKMKD